MVSGSVYDPRNEGSKGRGFQDYTKGGWTREMPLPYLLPISAWKSTSPIPVLYLGYVTQTDIGSLWPIAFFHTAYGSWSADSWFWMMVWRWCRYNVSSSIRIVCLIFIFTLRTADRPMICVRRCCHMSGPRIHQFRRRRANSKRSLECVWSRNHPWWVQGNNSVEDQERKEGNWDIYEIESNRIKN